MERSKYNVDVKAKDKRTHDGIVFASILEMKYYRDVLCPKVESGEIVSYELQKKYELQPGFVRNGKKVLPIYYVADFYIEYSNGDVLVIDTKGMPDNAAKLKRKMFLYVFPELNYVWLTEIKKYGGWITYEEAKRLRSLEKREKKKKEKENG